MYAIWLFSRISIWHSLALETSLVTIEGWNYLMELVNLWEPSCLLLQIFLFCPRWKFSRIYYRKELRIPFLEGIESKTRITNYNNWNREVWLFLGLKLSRVKTKFVYSFYYLIISMVEFFLSLLKMCNSGQGSSLIICVGILTSYTDTLYKHLSQLSGKWRDIRLL